ncbi:MAG: PD-(D/E)XK nuclease family protein [Nanoarchaeota archaeon]|nr:PD-(D/E)XK nuclease family protein [Nanoarchaeota archaeon]
MENKTEIEEGKIKIEENNINLRELTHCPYCKGKVVKRGIRKKKFEKIQRYYCKNCNKSLISSVTKNKTYPLRIILDCFSLYNRLHSFKEVSDLIYERYGIKAEQKTISLWISKYKNYLPFLRMREFVEKNYSKKDLIEESKLFHNQIYKFQYHRAKLDLILQEEFRHYRFKPVKEFLELIIAECPHHIFKSSGKRASEFKGIFDLSQVKIGSKNNSAVKIANFVMQAISNNKLRHEILQDFMLSNDFVTIATEVPVLIDSDDLRHYKHELNFNILMNLEDGEYLTGHIDLIQIRNGLVYIMDFKPSAKKEKPIEQLTLYALALSRLTGLRLYHFRCAWFDEEDYFEFFPLHVVYKLNKRKMRTK